eukprot:3885030-Amphidinium_carterae.1
MPGGGGTLICSNFVMRSFIACRRDKISALPPGGGEPRGGACLPLTLRRLVPIPNFPSSATV